MTGTARHGTRSWRNGIPRAWAINALASSLPLQDSVVRLKRIAGIDDWTAQYIALRPLRHPDTLPEGDVALQNMTGNDLRTNGKRGKDSSTI